MYAEASVFVSEGDRAVIHSPDMLPYLSGKCLSFAYHMYGKSMGNLTVLVAYQPNLEFKDAVPVWTMVGDQGRDWHKARIDIPASTEFRVSTGNPHNDLIGFQSPK